MKINKLHPYFVYFLIFGITFIIYFLTSSKNTPYDYFVRLADAFINHRLYLLENPSWLNELIPINGKYYVAYPPMPAILLIPFVAIFGAGFSQTAFSIFLGSLNPVILYSLLKRIKITSITAFVTTVFFAFGTNYWFLSSVGSSWYLAHIVALFFLLLAIRETFSKQRLFLIGLLLGASFWSRSTIIFTLPFFLFYMKDKFLPINKKAIYNLIHLFLGIGVFIGLDSIYNFLRFSSLSPISPYQMIPPAQRSESVKNGFLSLKNIPLHIDAMFLRLPQIQNSWSYITPSLYSIAIWVTSPAVVLIFKAKKSLLVFACWSAIITTFFIISLWVVVGFSQFGYRFAQDFMPFILILVALGVGQKPKPVAYLLLLLSIIVNLWGVIMINYLNIWTM
ncbi:MAG: hypothetical protein A3H50_00260 [Candidatus Levybacteria bacterium RIFCSPLOWO2_02_FULL_37_10]|nr:MAG: hypothetical protein A2860_03820 [Candidatus Levybacteria bacterium RIFCSPHIGHO2_01_FULL_37_33]OGH15611.1 MAG: hypothetical protein A3C97_01575 [Candidatus Levybacteria bacterium RIFCSPHIGHO2_02_FULL_37_11]OGH30119.1 MAG: hypothetical protein A3F30_01865 [Candidatus Levybacteria bacterium RIFCSPHIGHO2_12_FULL_37_12]OGH32372.1 MAG: hypothetical protein A2953_01860 [Candidatus Levybacteria bacterium RIFCSPLOWO2_01_FULL_36_54]OGH46306.1 MAG: hypothetical protein A3H50_00260 [Candidatus Lev